MIAATVRQDKAHNGNGGLKRVDYFSETAHLSTFIKPCVCSVVETLFYFRIHLVFPNFVTLIRLSSSFNSYVWYLKTTEPSRYIFNELRYQYLYQTYFNILQSCYIRVQGMKRCLPFFKVGKRDDFNVYNINPYLKTHHWKCR